MNTQAIRQTHDSRISSLREITEHLINRDSRLKFSMPMINELTREITHRLEKPVTLPEVMNFLFISDNGDDVVTFGKVVDNITEYVSAVEVTDSPKKAIRILKKRKPDCIVYISDNRELRDELFLKWVSKNNSGPVVMVKKSNVSFSPCVCGNMECINREEIILPVVERVVRYSYTRFQEQKLYREALNTLMGLTWNGES